MRCVESVPDCQEMLKQIVGTENCNVIYSLKTKCTFAFVNVSGHSSGQHLKKNQNSLDNIVYIGFPQWKRVHMAYVT